jgi:hypothetical protein
VVAHRVPVDQQCSGDLGRAPTTAQQDHGVEPVRLSGVACGAVFRPQLGEFLLVQPAVLRGQKTEPFQWLAPAS